jgi:hypothetical protein
LGFAEDDGDELARRLAAILQNWSIPLHDVSERLAVNSGADRPLLIARADRNGLVMRQPDVARCIATIRKYEIGLFIVDPFVETHEVNENANDQIKVVAGMFRDIAREGNCAVLLVHHTAKPPQGSNGDVAGNMNAARGASALIGVVRVVETLFPMSHSDGEKHGVPEHKRHLFVRLDDAKSNLGLVSPASTWFRRQSVTLANGDELGVLVPEDLGRPIQIQPDTKLRILREIDERWTSGNPFSGAPQSDRYIVPVIMKQFSFTRQQARALLRDWLIDSILVSEVFDKRSKRSGLRVLKWPE